jgi:PAS domain-containing protein
MADRDEDRRAVLPTEPLPLHHSWPLSGDGCRFDLGQLFDGEGMSDIGPGRATRLQGVGQWYCDLADNGLTWSAEVYDLFGFPRGATVSRAEAAARYSEASRAAMERLRAYAIRHRRGFTLDAEIVTAPGDRRWMRLVAAPICDGGRVVALRGLKWDVSRTYA